MVFAFFAAGMVAALPARRLLEMAGTSKSHTVPPAGSWAPEKAAAMNRHCKRADKSHKYIYGW